ncbi:hypothetical protein J4217_03995 [Candidatus Pacearchaeota archaeon]|nr:hypothetical protein [Candidatus Pacearchaeota archaeon]
MNIFPTLSSKWARVDLDEESCKSGLDFSNPSACQDWLDSLGEQKE